MKTAASILKEFLTQCGIAPPSYDLVKSEGPLHLPTFHYRVSFKDKDVAFTAMGTGGSKKEAKQTAARALIDKLTGLQLPDISPSYELVQTEGPIHLPTFRYRVSLNDMDVAFTAMGAGRSKKQAKRSAARALIDKLTDSENGTSEGGASATACGVATENVMDNLIGRWPSPTYETESKVDLPRERLFTIACTIWTFREAGEGKRKKIAKLNKTI